MTAQTTLFKPKAPSIAAMARNPVLRYGWRAHTILQSQINQLNTIHPEEYSIPFSKFELGGIKFARINDPDIAHHVLVTNHKNYDKGPVFRTVFQGILGEGLLTAEGELWRKNRRIMSPAFHHSAIQRLGHVFTGSTEAMLDELDHHAKSRRPVDLGLTMARLTMDIVMQALFSRGLADKAGELAEDIGEVLEHMGKPPVADLLGMPKWVPRQKLPKKALSSLERTATTLERVLADRFEGQTDEVPEHPDLLDLLLASRDDETGEGMDQAQLYDEILTLFGAGHETTANTLTWALHWLAFRPELMQRAQQEVRAVLGSGTAARAATLEDLKALDLVPRIIDETLRHCPPAYSVVRHSLGPDSIGDFETEAGRNVQVHLYLMHHNPKFWHNPWDFDPDHFLEDRIRERPRHVFMPFGSGPRVCIGKAFALQEAQIVLASILARYDLTLLAEKPIKPVARITVRPAAPVRGILTLAG